MEEEGDKNGYNEGIIIICFYLMVMFSLSSSYPIPFIALLLYMNGEHVKGRDQKIGKLFLIQ